MFKKILISVFLSFVFSQSFATEEVKDNYSKSVSYDEQIKEIFHSIVHNAGFYTSEYDSNNLLILDEKKSILNKIYEKIKSNQMLLKNVVYRKDADTIRVTFSDKENDLIFKVTYKTSYDPVTTNSIYADKDKIIDIKIMYRKNNDYEYINLENFDNLKSSIKEINDNPAFKDKVNHYRIVSSPGEQRCGFCHILAKNDSFNNSGIFFPRYHEYTKQMMEIQSSKSIFRETDFSLKSKKDVHIKLPEELSEPFYFSSVSANYKNGFNHELMTKYSRIIFETPELLEVLAKDNKASYCINVSPNNNVVSNENYVCADYKNKKLYIKHNNKIQSNKGGYEGVKPFY